MTQFWDDFPVIKYDLARVHEFILESVRSRNGTITDALSGLANRNGKLLRPGFVVLGARMRGDSADLPPDWNGTGRAVERAAVSGRQFPGSNGLARQTAGRSLPSDRRVAVEAPVPDQGPLPDRLYRVAASIELLHMATLVHDDIIDEAKSRRGFPTLHSEYGTKVAVLMGDFLFSRCYRLLADNASVENARRLATVVSQIVTGEIDQSVREIDSLSTPRAYLRRVVGKTATLIADSFYLGASEAGIGLAQTLLLRRVGYSVGMAFQIIDDILDFTGRAEALGKAPGSDLRQGIVTLPVIYALKGDASDEIRRCIQHPELLTDNEVGQVIEEVDRSGGFELAREKAELYTRRALRQIALLPRGGNREILAGVTRNLLDREY